MSTEQATIGQDTSAQSELDILINQVDAGQEKMQQLRGRLTTMLGRLNGEPEGGLAVVGDEKPTRPGRFGHLRNTYEGLSDELDQSHVLMSSLERLI